VVEFYASAETDVTLANLAGDPIGSLGTPLPGAAEVRVAAFDVRTRRIELGADGLARECEPDEVGLLVSRVNPEACAGARLRGLFEPGDAWISTGDLFRRDEHGRLWMVDPVSTLVRTARAVVSPGAARLAVETIPSVDLAVAYGVPERGAEVVVVAIMLRPGNQLTADELDRALQPVPLAQRPRYVHVVASIPMTGSSRPRPNELRATGVARPAESAPVWRLERSGRYRLLPVGKADQGEA
jgi:putative long chain acyl-CoA synthase